MFNASQPAAAASLVPLLAFIRSHALHITAVENVLTPYVSFNAWHDTLFTSDTHGTDPTGGAFALASRLVPLAACTEAGARAAAVEAVAGLVPHVLMGHLVAGGAVAAADRSSKEARSASTK